MASSLARAVAGLRLALSMFTQLPLPRQDAPLRRATLAAAVRWLPAVGALLGALAAVPLLLVRAVAGGDGSLLGATLGVATLAVGTRALHLDGLADTADGLGAHTTAETALGIMRRSDIGPFGVVTLVFTLLAQVAAVALAESRGCGAQALVVAAATGRLSVVHAAGPRVPAAHPNGFGVLVAGCLGGVSRWSLTAATLLGGAAVFLTVPGGWPGCLVTQLAALLVGFGLRRHAVRRFGGITGDVFGALIETTSMVTLVGLALAR